MFLKQPLLARGVRILIECSVKFDILWVRVQLDTICVLRGSGERLSFTVGVSRVGPGSPLNVLRKVKLSQPFCSHSSLLDPRHFAGC